MDFAPKPECCVCALKVHAVTYTSWHLIRLSQLEEGAVPKDYPYKKGVVCGVCLRKFRRPDSDVCFRR